MGFKAAFKKLRKKVGLPAITLGTTGRVVAAAVTRGKSEKVVQQLKGVGAALKAVKGAPLPRITKAEAAHVIKTFKARAPRVVPISSVQATTAPGGAPLAKKAPRRRAAAKAKAPRAAKAPRRASGGGRKPPKGGLDLKALAASWRAAGKPGSWRDWIKKNR